MCPRLCGSSRKPVTMEKKARITSGITIAFPGRLLTEVCGFPQNVMNTMRNVYRAVRKAHSKAARYNQQFPRSPARASQTNRPEERREGQEGVITGRYGG